MASNVPSTSRVTDRSRAPKRPRQQTSVSALVLLGLISLGCLSLHGPDKPQLIYTPEEFRAELAARVPGLKENLSAAPFVVRPEDVAKAEARILEAPLGPDRVRALVKSLSADPPEGFGLKYHWLASSGALRTLASRQGNCVSFASVLIGLGRGLGWPIYYAEARARRPETHEYEEVTFISDHMVVIIAARTFQMVIDFTGQVDHEYELRPIDDLTAYAHLINNIGGQHIARVAGNATDDDWKIALQGFELASQIQPDLARAWNNRGIALTRLKRYEEAQLAYERALSLGMVFDSASHNLEIMRTRAQGETIVAEEPVSR
jgi:tetratricopeptide (TPR) repeat protein